MAWTALGGAQKVRLVEACALAGLPMEGIAAAVRAGRLSLAFLEAAPYRRWAVRSTRTYRQVSQDTGIPLEVLGGILESMGSPGWRPTSRCARTSWSRPPWPPSSGSRATPTPPLQWHLRVMARPLPAGSVELGSDADGKGAEMSTDDLTRRAGHGGE